MHEMKVEKGYSVVGRMKQMRCCVSFGGREGNNRIKENGNGYCPLVVLFVPVLINNGWLVTMYCGWWWSVGPLLSPPSTIIKVYLISSYLALWPVPLPSRERRYKTTAR